MYGCSLPPLLPPECGPPCCAVSTVCIAILSFILRYASLAASELLPSPALASSFFFASLANSTLCVDDPASSVIGAQLDVSACTGGANQQWTYDPAPRTLINSHTGWCMTANVDPAAAGTPISQWPCVSSLVSLPRQQWILSSTSGTVTPAAHPGLCLETGSGSVVSASALLQLGACDGGADQQWTFTDCSAAGYTFLARYDAAGSALSPLQSTTTTTISSAAAACSSTTLCVAFDSLGTQVSSVNTLIPQPAGLCQGLYVKNTSSVPAASVAVSNLVLFSGSSSTFCLHVPDASLTAVQLGAYAYLGGANQQWTYDPSALTLANQASGFCMTANGTVAGTAVIQWPCALAGQPALGPLNQRWLMSGGKLSPVGAPSLCVSTGALLLIFLEPCLPGWRFQLWGFADCSVPGFSFAQSSNYGTSFPNPATTGLARSVTACTLDASCFTLSSDGFLSSVLSVWYFAHNLGALTCGGLYLKNGTGLLTVPSGFTTSQLMLYSNLALCIGTADAAAAPTTTGAPLASRACAGAADQLWTLDAVRHTLVNAHGGYCMTVQGDKLGAGTLVTLAPCAPASLGQLTQQWALLNGGLTPASSPGLCVVTAQGAAVDGVGLQLGTCTGVATQQWTFDAGGDCSIAGFIFYPGGDVASPAMMAIPGLLFSVATGCALDLLCVAFNTDSQLFASLDMFGPNLNFNQGSCQGLYVKLSDVTATANSLTAAVLIVSSLNSSLCLDVPASALSAGAVLDVAACWGGANQLWTHQPDTLTLASRNTGLCMGVDGNSTTAGAAIVQQPCAPPSLHYSGQSWALSPSGTLVPRSAPALCLETDGARLQLALCAGAANQSWAFIDTALLGYTFYQGLSAPSDTYAVQGNTTVAAVAAGAAAVACSNATRCVGFGTDGSLKSTLTLATLTSALMAAGQGLYLKSLPADVLTMPPPSLSPPLLPPPLPLAPPPFLPPSPSPGPPSVSAAVPNKQPPPPASVSVLASAGTPLQPAVIAGPVVAGTLAVCALVAFVYWRRKHRTSIQATKFTTFSTVPSHGAELGGGGGGGGGGGSDSAPGGPVVSSKDPMLPPDGLVGVLLADLSEGDDRADTVSAGLLVSRKGGAHRSMGSVSGQSLASRASSKPPKQGLSGDASRAAASVSHQGAAQAGTGDVQGGDSSPADAGSTPMQPSPFVYFNVFANTCRGATFQRSTSTHSSSCTASAPLEGQDLTNLSFHPARASQPLSVLRPLGRVHLLDIRDSVRLDLDWQQDVIIRWDQCLGSGSCGSVYRGVFQGRPVAVKTVQPSLCGELLGDLSPHREGSFLHEVHIMARLEHRNVVTLYGAGLKPPQVFLVLELLKGDLYECLHKGVGPAAPLPMARVLQLASDILCGLAYLHSLDVLHRDLKPANIMLDATGTAKIADFGLARGKYKTYLSTNMVDAGTVAYMAPESFDDQIRGVSAKADIFGFAVMLWEMVAMQRPWEGIAHAAIIYRVVLQHERPVLPEGSARCPPRLAALIVACWAPSPHDRPSAAEALEELLAMSLDLPAELTPTREASQLITAT